jgi:long-chain acyl-CoA synthetase
VPVTNPYASRPWTQHYGTAANRFSGVPCVVSEFFDRNAQSFGPQPCLTFRGNSISYADVAQLSDGLAVGLRSLGIGKGDRVGYCMSNHPAFVVLYIALWKLGAVGVGFNPLYPAERLAHQATDCEIKAIVTSDEPALLQKLKLVQRRSLSSIRLLIANSSTFCDIGHANAPGNVGDADLLPLESLIEPLSHPTALAIDPQHDLAALCYTGGTTGVPKGVQLTHANLSINALQMLSWFPELVRGQDSIFAAGPFTHISGVGPLLTFAGAAGLELVIQDRFNADETLDLIDAGRISMLLLNPTMCMALLAKMEGRSVDWSKVKIVTCAAAPMTPDVRDRLFLITGKKVINLFGMTETSPGIMQGLPEVERYATAIGCPLPGTDVELRSPEDPTFRVGIGEVGEICVRGPQVMSGYWNQETENRTFFVDGFFRTGDLASMTSDGVFFLVDRLKNVIIASGYNVYPTQVEAVLSKHPAIHEVAIVGVHDAYRGETVKAFVSLRSGHSLTLEQLKSELGDQLSPVEFPKILEILPELPKTENMKISRQNWITAAPHERLKTMLSKNLASLLPKRDIVAVWLGAICHRRPGPPLSLWMIQ